MNKKIILGPRPKFRDLSNRLIKADTILCLLKHEEGANELGEMARASGYSWINMPSDARPWSNEISNPEHWLAVALTINNLLLRGSKVYIHCAAGIHRTGISAYTYYRKYENMTHKEAMRCLDEHRPGVILREIGNKINLMKEYFDEYSSVASRGRI